MIPLKPEETLHAYLRRHLEKISQSEARKFAEQRRLPEKHAAPRESRQATT